MLVVPARSSSTARPVKGAQHGWEVAKTRIGNDADGLRRLLDLQTEAGDTAEAPIPVAVETARGHTAASPGGASPRPATCLSAYAMAWPRRSGFTFFRCTAATTGQLRLV
jgi:hypothetical protein